MVHGTEAMACARRRRWCARSARSPQGRGPVERQGVTTGECVVAAPCSALIALADHYGIPVTVGGRR